MFVTEIAADDLLYKYILNRRGKDGHAAYFEGGRQNAAQVAAAAKRILKREDIKVLEFASGYGRVTRHLKSVMPHADITASDIHPQACSFMREQLGVRACISSANPATLSVGDGYDFIFVLSLFSHLPHRTFGEWLQVLYNRLAPGGALLITAHGDTSRAHFAGIDLSKEENGEGWIYRRRSDQPDLDLEDYGTMIVTPRYVVTAVERCERAILASFVAGAWLTHQDEWVIKKPASEKS